MAVPSFGSRRPRVENPLGKTKLENVVSNGGRRRFRFRDGQVVTMSSLSHGLSTRLLCCRAQSSTIGFRKRSDQHYRYYSKLMAAPMIVQSCCRLCKITDIWLGSSSCPARSIPERFPLACTTLM